jgi:hypothetical protein
VVPMSRDRAEEALRDIANTEARSAQLYGYSAAAPHLILWGILWAIGYGLTDFWPQRPGVVWLVVVGVGLVGGFLLEVRSKGASSGLGWRFAVMALTIFAFISATFAVMAPVTVNQVGAFISLVAAAVYAMIGVWAGKRFLIAGIVIAALTLGGFFFVHQYFNLWMGAVGGAALVLAGYWFRNV